MALTGMPGIGKTQIALAYAHKYRQDYNAVFWVVAASRENLIADFATLAYLLALSKPNDQKQEQAVAAIQRWLATNKNWLLILDNADNLDLVQKFMPASGHGHQLLTTRIRAVRGFAKPVEVDKMTPSQGALLLLKRTGISITAEQQELAEKITVQLDGLPLALDQAGAYIENTGVSLHEYQHLYQTEGKELRDKPRTGYNLSIAATFSLVFIKVAKANPEAAELLQLCAFLSPDGIPEELLINGVVEFDTVLSAALSQPLVRNELFEQACRFSLLKRDSQAKMLNIHRVVQDVLLDKMEIGLQKQWAERAVKVTNRSFPDVKFSTWSVCDRLLSNAIITTNLIKKWDFEFPEAADLINKVARYLFERADYTPVELLLKHSLRIREKMFGEDNSGLIELLNNLVELYDAQAQFEKAEPIAQRALNISKNNIKQKPQDAANSFYNMAMVCEAQGYFDRAESLYNEALEFQQKILGLEHLDIARTLNNLAKLYDNQGYFDKAEKLYQKALILRNRLLEPTNPSIAESMDNLGLLYIAIGQYDKAEPLLMKSKEIRQVTLGDKHPDIATSFNNLGIFYKNKNDYNKAEFCFLKAKNILENIGLKNQHTANILDNLALLYITKNQYNKAEPLHLKAMELREEILPRDHPDLAISFHNLALFYHSQEKYQEAKFLYQKALKIWQRNLKHDHPYLIQGWVNYATLLFETRNESEANLIITTINNNQLPNINW